MSSSTLVIENLRVEFSTVMAVKDLSLHLAEGDVCALVGPNGAGKTTTIRAIAGLQKPSSGEVSICGKKWSQQSDEIRSQIGYMPDFFPVYEGLKAWEFLQHFALAYRVPRVMERIEECLQLVHLENKRDSLCSELSRGMKQRLVLAKTLLHDPQLLILDEPASGLDPKARIDLKEILLGLQTRGKTILVSSHILSELSGFCNCIAIMEKGQLVQHGRLSELGGNRAQSSVMVRWRGAAEQLENKVRQLGVDILEVRPQQLRISASKPVQKQLLQEILSLDLELLEWKVLDHDLEQIYLASGAKETS